MSRKNKIIEPPEGCQEIPGFILTVEDGKKWLTSKGEVTENWQERGVWKTPMLADEARKKLFA